MISTKLLTNMRVSCKPSRVLEVPEPVQLDLLLGRTTFGEWDRCPLCPHCSMLSLHANIHKKQY